MSSTLEISQYEDTVKDILSILGLKPENVWVSDETMISDFGFPSAVVIAFEQMYDLNTDGRTLLSIAKQIEMGRRC
jgi:hypothetical protein